MNPVKTMSLKDAKTPWEQHLANYKEFLENQKKGPYSCQFCRRRLKYVSSWIIHENHYKTIYQSLSKHSNSLSSLQQPLHRLMGDQNDQVKKSNLECNVCFKLFKCTVQLHFHYKVHFGERPCACNICGKIFERIKYLCIHYRKHTDERRLYTCTICGSSYNQNSDLTIHYRTHTGQRPYTCQVCGRTFTSSANRLVHYRTHSGYRPYFCNTCGKSFNQSHVLIEHIRIHTGEKPYECGLCVQSFVSSGDLRKHTIRKHNRYI